MFGGLNGMAGLSAWSVYNKVVFSLIFNNEMLRPRIRLDEEIAKAMASDDIEEVKAVLPMLSLLREDADISHERALIAFKEASDLDKKIMLMEAWNSAALSDDECLRLLAVHKTKNGIAYSRASIGNLSASDLFPMMIETLMACAELDVDNSLISAEDLETLAGRRVNIVDCAADVLSRSPDIATSPLLSLSIKKTVTAMASLERTREKG